MAGFATGLVNTLTSGLNDRLNIKRQREQQLQQEQDALRQNQLLFEQQQRQQLQAQPQQMQMQGDQMRNVANIQQELEKQAQNIKIETTPGLRELLASGDMQKIQIELPNYLQTQGDVQFFNTYKKLAAQMIDPNAAAYQKEMAIGRAKSETLAGDIKSGIRQAPGMSRKSGGGSSSKSTGAKAEKAAASKLNKLETQIEKKKAELAKENSYSDANPAVIKNLASELNELEAMRSASTGADIGFTMTEAEKAAIKPKEGASKAATSKPTSTPQGTSILEALKKIGKDIQSAKPPTRKAY